MFKPKPVPRTFPDDDSVFLSRGDPAATAAEEDALSSIVIPVAFAVSTAAS